MEDAFLIKAWRSFQTQIEDEKMNYNTYKFNMQ